MVLALKNIDLTRPNELGECTPNTCDNWSVGVLRMHKVNIAVFTVYIPPHDEETKIKVLHAIHRCIELMGIPYLICGDFNEHPYDFDKWGWAPM